MKMSNKFYDVMKWIALIVLPALATFYGTLAGIWSLPYADSIPETIMAIDLFIGVILGVSNATYKKTNG